MLLKLAWRNLWRSKRRTLITAASVFFAVVLSILMQSMQLGTYDVMIKNVVEYYTGYIQIHQKGYFKDQSLDNSLECDEAFIKKVHTMEGVTSAVARIENFALVSGDLHSKGALVIGTDPEEEDHLTSLKQKVVEGTYFQKNDKAVMLSEGLAKQLKIKVGDSLIILGQGYQAISAAGLYHVCALVKFGNPELNKRMLYLPLNEASNLFSMQGRITSLSLGIDNPKNTEKITSQIQSKLDTTQLEVMGWPELLPELKQGIEGDYIGGYIMLGVLYLIISFGIFGTLLMMLAERRHEFGVLIALGMRKTQLGWTVMLELINISLLGAISGMLASIPVILYYYYNPILLEGKMAESYENFGFEPVMKSSLDPSIFITNTLIVLVLALILSLYPFFKIKKLKAIDAMRR